MKLIEIIKRKYNITCNYNKKYIILLMVFIIITYLLIILNKGILFF